MTEIESNLGSWLGVHALKRIKFYCFCRFEHVTLLKELLPESHQHEVQTPQRGVDCLSQWSLILSLQSSLPRILATTAPPPLATEGTLISCSLNITCALSCPGSALVLSSACSALLPLTPSDLLYGPLSFFQVSPLKPMCPLGMTLISLGTDESFTFYASIQLNVCFGCSVCHSVSHYFMYESVSAARAWFR